MTIAIRDKSPKTYIVLGANQGGTSLISKALHDQGIDMGVANNKATYENNKFVSLNRNILIRAGGNWRNVPSRENINRSIPGLEPRIKQLVKQHEAEFWGFKDPRTALLADHYLEHMNDDVYLVCIFRKPSKIGESLKRREGNMNNGGEIAKTYYRRILETITKFCEL